MGGLGWNLKKIGRTGVLSKKKAGWDTSKKKSQDDNFGKKSQDKLKKERQERTEWKIKRQDRDYS